MLAADPLSLFAPGVGFDGRGGVSKVGFNFGSQGCSVWGSGLDVGQAPAQILAGMLGLSPGLSQSYGGGSAFVAYQIGADTAYLDLLSSGGEGANAGHGGTDGNGEIDSATNPQRHNVLFGDYGLTNALEAHLNANGDNVADAVASTRGDLAAFCAHRRAAGWDVLIVCDVAPRAQVGVPANFDAARLVLNAALAGWELVDAVAVIGSDPRFGDVADCSNPYWFSAVDLVHWCYPTSCVVARRLVEAFSALFPEVPYHLAWSAAQTLVVPSTASCLDGLSSPVVDGGDVATVNSLVPASALPASVGTSFAVTTGTAPVYHAAGIGGQPALHAGGAQWMFLASPNLAAATMIWVCALSSQGYGPVLSGSTYRIFTGPMDAGAGQGFSVYQLGASATCELLLPSSTIATDGSAHVYSVVVDGTKAGTSYGIDGVAQALTVAGGLGSDPGLPAYGGADGSMWYAGNGGDAGGVGMWGLLLTAPYPMTAAELDAVVRAAGAVYGITVA